jgi:hypothetical protein
VSAAQLLIVLVGVGASAATFMLMRFPQHRRVEYRGRAFSMRASAMAALAVLAVCLVFAWAQGRYEAP